MTPTKKKFQLKTNVQGVLPAGTCSYCDHQSTTHYCCENQKGTGCYINGKEVCGHIMCTLCVIGWDGEAEKFRGTCKECMSAKDLKGKKTVGSVSTQKKGYC